MAESPGNEFNIKAVPDQAMMRKLAYLAARDNDSVLTGGVRSGNRNGARREQLADDDLDLLMTATQAAEAVYREALARVRRDLDIADQAAAQALAEIHELLAENERRRQTLLDRAVRLEDGTAVFLTEDGQSVVDEHGRVVDDDVAAALPAEDLRARPRWESLERINGDDERLHAEVEAIREDNERRAEARTRIESGDMSLEELEALERELDAAIPERVRRHRDDLLVDGAAHEAPAADPGVVTSASATDLSATPNTESPADLPQSDPPHQVPGLGR